MIEAPAKGKNLFKIITISILGLFAISIFLNIYLVLKLQESNKNLLECKSSQRDCPVCPEQKVCKSFDWISKYVQVVRGDIQWTDCGEGSNICAFWENYQADVPLPTVKILACSQQGTALDKDGNFITGLDIGEHTIIGATIRPCQAEVTAK